MSGRTLGATADLSVLARAHPSWLADGLAALGPIGRAALAAPDAPHGRSVRRQLERGLVAHLAPMPVGPSPAGRPPRADELALASTEVLFAALEQLGLRAIAPIVRAAPAGAAEAIAAGLGAAGPAFLAAVRAVVPGGNVGARVRRLAPLLASPGPDLLVRAGVLEAAPGLAHADQAGERIAAAVAQRLPVPIGRPLLEAVRAATADAASLEVLIDAVAAALRA